MHLEKTTLTELETPTSTADQNAILRCQYAKNLAEASNYEAAREALGDLWQGLGERPRLDGLDQATSADVLLRTGNLSGGLGSVGQVEGAQERAKDLISESARIFQSLNQTEKFAEAQVDLAS